MSIYILVQEAMGFAMTFYYRLTVTEVFAFVEYIMTKANFGWLIQLVHRWSANMMVLMVILHVFHMYIMHTRNVNIFVKKESNFDSKINCNHSLISKTLY
jgi:quinol-cytochrome oxidoreductase complex cytochrome b subunit